MTDSGRYGLGSRRHLRCGRLRRRKRGKRLVRDSVFKRLFSDPKYLWQLYRVIHPEDTETTEKDLEQITLDGVFSSGLFNDLGFVAGKSLIILVEAQTTWSLNILPRMFLYAAETCDEYIFSHKGSLHSRAKTPLPPIELYMIYTGTEKNIPEKVSLRDDFFPGQRCDIDATVHILNRRAQEGDVLFQFLGFTNTYNRQLGKSPGDCDRAIANTIRICRRKGFLKDFINEREREVMKLLSEEYENYVQERRFEEAHESGVEEGMEKGLKKGLKEGVEIGRNKEKNSIALKMIEGGVDPSLITIYTGLTPAQIGALAGS